MYTIKLDWKRSRIAAVLVAVLTWADASSSLLRALVDDPHDLAGYLDGRYAKDMQELGATLKLNLSEQQLDELEEVLRKSAEQLRAELEENCAALVDIRLYRQAVRETQ